MDNYKNKYLKYKNKYYNFKKNKMRGGDLYTIGAAAGAVFTSATLIALLIYYIVNEDKNKTDTEEKDIAKIKEDEAKAQLENAKTDEERAKAQLENAKTDEERAKAKKKQKTLETRK